MTHLQARWLQSNFVQEGHPLVRTGRYPPPSRTVRMSGAAFAARLRAGGAPPPPIAYRSGRERAYLQAELPPSWAARLSVPPLWRSVGVAQAQAMRLWVSAEGAVSPAHFDNAASFLAQIHGRKRLLFFPPAAISDLYPYPTDHPLARRSRVDLYADASARFTFVEGLFGEALCRADLDGDGTVGGSDLTRLLSAWNTDRFDADLDDSGFVDGADLAEFLARWGVCSP